jgi:hypothetical protein
MNPDEAREIVARHITGRAQPAALLDEAVALLAREDPAHLAALAGERLDPACDAFLAELAVFVAADRAERGAVFPEHAAHLAACPDCRASFDAVRPRWTALAAGLRALAEPIRVVLGGARLLVAGWEPPAAALAGAPLTLGEPEASRDAAPGDGAPGWRWEYADDERGWTLAVVLRAHAGRVSLTVAGAARGAPLVVALTSAQDGELRSEPLRATGMTVSALPPGDYVVELREGDGAAIARLPLSVEAAP